MDYKEKVIALLNDQELSKEQKEKLENIFPELQENKDDRIVRCLLNYFNHVRYNGLEKQGEKKSADINGEDYGIDGLYHAIKILERTVGRVTGYQSDDGILSHEAAINAVKELYKKQGGQEHFYDFNANDWYVSKVDGKIHNMTYNPTDKVEPKFKVGDWITNGDYTWKIVEVKPLHYILQSQDGNIVDDTISYVDEQFHSFTIDDAKDGDVLVDSYSKDSFIILYKGIDKERNILAHCGWNGYYLFVTSNDGLGCGGLDNTDYLPATNEQRELLFEKMNEAEYKWDAEKKELKKIEVVSKESEDGGIRKAIISILKGETGYTSKEDTDKYVAWVEKQGKRLGADEVTKHQWISVEDELPNNYERVIAAFGRHFARICFHCGDTWYLDNPPVAEPMSGITHWMPLPPPPHHIIDANKKVDRVIGTADHIKIALDVLNKKGGEK